MIYHCRWERREFLYRRDTSGLQYRCKRRGFRHRCERRWIYRRIQIIGLGYPSSISQKNRREYLTKTYPQPAPLSNHRSRICLLLNKKSAKNSYSVNHRVRWQLFAPILFSGPPPPQKPTHPSQQRVPPLLLFISPSRKPGKLSPPPRSPFLLLISIIPASPLCLSSHHLYHTIHTPLQFLKPGFFYTIGIEVLWRPWNIFPDEDGRRYV